MNIFQHVKITAEHKDCPFSNLAEYLNVEKIEFSNCNSYNKECYVYFNKEKNLKQIQNTPNIKIIESKENILKIQYYDEIFENILNYGILDGMNLYRKGDIENICIEEVFLSSMESFLCTTQKPYELCKTIQNQTNSTVKFEIIQDIGKFINSKYNVFPKRNKI